MNYLPKSLDRFRFARRMPVLLLAVIWFAAPVHLALAQRPASGLDVPEEEEEPGPRKPAAKPAGGAAEEQEEDAPAAKPAGPPGLVEEEEEAMAADAAAAAAGEPLQLAPPLLKDLFNEAREDEQPLAAEPVGDIVDFWSGPTVEQRRIRLLPTWLGPAGPLKDRRYTFYRSSTGKGKAAWELDGNKINKLEYYEQRMLRRAAAEFELVADELDLRAEDLSKPGQRFDLSNVEVRRQAFRAEQLLATALAEHDSAVQRLERRGDGWRAAVREPLVDALFNLQHSQALLLLTQREQRGFRAAEQAADRIAGQPYVDGPRKMALRPIFEEIYLRQALAAFERKDYPAARDLLAEVVERYPLDPGEKAATFRRMLTDKARETMNLAEQEKDERKRFDLYDQAALIWPTLEGLAERRSRLQNRYTILECAYTTSPKSLSPLTARLPVERHATRLMFESLVRWTDDEQTGPHYEAELAAGRPRSLAKGRHFLLVDCLWSDSAEGKPRRLIAEDVRRTWEILKQVGPSDFPVAWSEAVDRVDASELFEVSIGLDRDYWQPLAFMDFMILPRHKFPAGPVDQKQLAAFDAEPVGTGPYRLLEREQERVRFVTNPTFRKPGGPKISEVAFNRLELAEAVQRFERNEVQLVYGLSREQVNALGGKGKRIEPLSTRSICFLAPNYRRKHEWLHNANYRQAIAHAIDRKKILDDVFRPKGREADHTELHGPFPHDSWAYAPDAALFHPGQAAVAFARAKAEELTNPTPLTLVYPAGDASIEAACKAIQEQLAVVGIQIDLPREPPPPEQFYHVVVTNHDFDLAYWQHDFPDETYWLWPLFDPDDQQADGANFMGCVPDKDLRDLFKDLAVHKQFSLIRRQMHQLHKHIAQQALIVPLWQLDSYVAVSDSLKNAAFDPIYLFRNVENWELATQK